MPNRIIRESCRTSPTLDDLSDGAERLFWRLTTVADDFGRFESDPRILLSNCFPLKIGVLTVGMITEWYKELEACGLVQTYVCNGKHFGFFVTWEKYQSVRAKASKYPEPTKENIRKHMSANVPVFEESRNRGIEDMSGSETKAEEPVPPNGNGGTPSLFPSNGSNGHKPKAVKKKKEVIRNYQLEWVDEFWQSYPVKQWRVNVNNAFGKINPDRALFDRIMSGLERAKKSEEWARESGKFIPHPAKWLELRGWENVYTERKDAWQYS